MITLVLGGARSGKSRYAEGLAAASGREKLYVATCEPMDDDMRARIARHRADRAEAGWKTLEEPTEIAGIISDSKWSGHAILVDCLTLWLGNLMHHKHDIHGHAERLLAALKTTRADVILVGNEVGLGIVPESALGRSFRDEAGLLHQQIAAGAQQVVMMVAGLPIKVKG